MSNQDTPTTPTLNVQFDPASAQALSEAVASGAPVGSLKLVPVASTPAPDQSMWEATIRRILEEALRSGVLRDIIDRQPSGGGWRSRKLWLTILCAVVIVIALFFLQLDPSVGIGALVTIVTGYNATNAYAKRPAATPGTGGRFLP